MNITASWIDYKYFHVSRQKAKETRQQACYLTQYPAQYPSLGNTFSLLMHDIKVECLVKSTVLSNEKHRFICRFIGNMCTIMKHPISITIKIMIQVTWLVFYLYFIELNLTSATKLAVKGNINQIWLSRCEKWTAMNTNTGVGLNNMYGIMQRLVGRTINNCITQIH